MLLPSKAETFVVDRNNMDVALEAKRGVTQRCREGGDVSHPVACAMHSAPACSTGTVTRWTDLCVRYYQCFQTTCTRGYTANTQTSYGKNGRNVLRPPLSSACMRGSVHKTQLWGVTTRACCPEPFSCQASRILTSRTT